MLACLDFETYYDKDFSLSKITTEAYIRDPRFEVIGVSLAVGDAAPVWFSGTWVETHSWLNKQVKWDETLLLAHNCAFDAAILNWHFGIKPKGYLDTLSLANALYGVNESVSLKSLAERYQLPAKGTEVLTALGKRRRDFSPAELAAYGEYCKHDTWLCRSLFDLMAPQFTKAELRAVDLTIRMFAEPILELDLPLLEEHLINTRADQRESLSRLAVALSADCEADVKTVLMSNQKFAALLEYLGVDVPMKVSATTGKEAPAFAKTDEAFQALLEHENPVVQAAVAARLGNKSTIEESRTEAFIEIAKRGALPVPLKYSGAAVTHRWAGGDGLNLQNLPRGGKLREAIRAPKGFKIVSADLSNIELRLGLYMACQDDKVQLIRDGIDLYMDVATGIYGKTYEEIKELGKKSKERTVSKVVSLASIYGTGAAKLKDTLRTQGKVKVSQEEAQRMTDMYRGTYTRVVASWDEGREVLDALYAKENYGEYLRPGVLRVVKEGIIKPSGLMLSYPDLRWTKGEDGKMGYTYEQKRKSRDRVYGSKCYQRCIQALARDIICEHMLKIDKRYRVVGTVHDEIICLVAEAEVEDAKAHMLEVMRTPPAWAKDLPLDAEVAASDTYGGAH